MYRFLLSTTETTGGQKVIVSGFSKIKEDSGSEFPDGKERRHENCKNGQLSSSGGRQTFSLTLHCSCRSRASSGVSSVVLKVLVLTSGSSRADAGARQLDSSAFNDLTITFNNSSA